MFAQFKSLPQLFDYFKDEDTCLAYWVQMRWGDEGPICPHCKNRGAYKTNRGYKCKTIGCQKKFSALTDTLFENTKLPLRKWFAAIYLCSAHKKGVSSCQVARDLDIHQKSAWYMLHRIRQAFKDQNAEPIGGDGVIVEADETYIGGKAKNFSNKKRKEIKDGLRGRHDNKTPIMGFIERSNKLRFVQVSSGMDMPDIVRENVDKGSVLMTDKANLYYKLGKEYAHHGVVDHIKHEYGRDGVYYTNSIEGSFSHLDRMVMGVYHYISPKHMQAYCNEQAYRYNTRKITEPVRFEETVKKFGIPRVRYKLLTAPITLQKEKPHLAG